MTNQVIPEAAVEALARVLANEALFDADIEGYGWNAETDSSDHFMPTARKRATGYLEAAAPHLGRIITTAEDLDSLPNGSVVLSDIYLHYLNAQRISFQRWEDGLWYRGARSADTHPDNFLPATVIHVPEPTN